MDVKERLIALLNEANPDRRAMLKNELVFGVPEPNVEENKNTKVIITAATHSGFMGSRVLFYDRLNLNTVRIPLTLQSEEPFTEEVIFSLYRSIVDFDVTSDDIIITNMGEMEIGEVRTITITARPESLAWIGEKEISLLYGLPTSSNELHEFMNFVLPHELN